MSRTEFKDLAGKFSKDGMSTLGMSTGLKVLAGIGATAYGVTQSLYTVDGNHRAYIPSYMIFVQALGRSHHPPGSKDLQIINISLGVMLSPDSLRLAALRRNLGSDYDEKVLLRANERIYFLKINDCCSMDQ